MKRIVIILLTILVIGCTSQERLSINRYSLIPESVVKKTPANDLLPPILHSDEYEKPIPLPYPVNTRGGEDSAFVTPDGKTLYFFYTPDVLKPVEEQIIDGITGVYVSYKYENNSWSEPKRVWLSESGELSLDGCEFVQDDTIWFCSAREGYQGLNWFSAENKSGEWGNYEIVDFPDDYEVGELHVNNNWTKIIYHSQREGSLGGYDLWVIEFVNEEWSEPVNLKNLNTEVTEGWPYLSEDESELWFLRWHEGSPAIYKSERNGSVWGTPELIISQFASEPSVDDEGNLYFTHHFIENATMLDADIYVAYKK